MTFRGKHVLVLGLGETGLAMAKWLSRQGAVLRVADSREAPPNLAALNELAVQVDVRLGAFAAPLLEGIECLAISPGVPMQAPLVQQALSRGLPVISEVELFVGALRSVMPQSKIIAITGSNGKTTTTALTAYLLNAVGVPAIACGNISPSVLDALMDVLDHGAPGGVDAASLVWVLELSSFQLESTQTLNADAATVLNVSEDHLDRYTGMSDYAQAKARVFQGQGLVLLNRDDAYCQSMQPTDGGAGGDGGAARVVRSFGLEGASRAQDYGLKDGWIMRGDEALLALASLKLVGLHNAMNAMAALALCEAVGVPVHSALPALAQFSGLAHRVERVAEIAGVTYYDDSKGTNVGATLAAVQGMGCKVAIILGGEGKSQDFSPLKAALAVHARAVALIGRDAGLIAAAIEGCGVVMQKCADMLEAVQWCATQARCGDAVLLSPACASFDMFRGYAHRAEVFVDAVRHVEKEAA